MYQILVVDDDVQLLRTVERGLSKYHQFKVAHALSGEAALQMIRRNPPDLLVLDVLMPGMDGYEVCSRLRADPLYRDLPILFLSGKDQVIDRVIGLRLGADDYLGKPFDIEELMLRIRGMLRRVHRKRREEEHAAPPTGIRVGDLTLNAKTSEVSAAGRSKALLTPVEYNLLHHLMLNAGSVLSSHRLLQEVWGYPPLAGSPALVRAHVRNLRQKIEPDPRRPAYLRTVRRRGYTIALPEGSSVETSYEE